jgi:hypothetical protein
MTRYKIHVQHNTVSESYSTSLLSERIYTVSSDKNIEEILADLHRLGFLTKGSVEDRCEYVWYPPKQILRVEFNPK